MPLVKKTAEFQAWLPFWNAKDKKPKGKAKPKDKGGTFKYVLMRLLTTPEKAYDKTPTFIEDAVEELLNDTVKACFFYLPTFFKFDVEELAPLFMAELLQLVKLESVEESEMALIIAVLEHLLFCIYPELQDGIARMRHTQTVTAKWVEAVIKRF